MLLWHALIVGGGGGGGGGGGSEVGKVRKVEGW